MRLRTLATLLVFLGGFSALLAGPPSKDAKKKPEAQKKEEVLTFTTADMERKYGKSAKPVAKSDSQATPDGKPKPDPLAQLQASQDAKREKIASRAEAGARARSAQENVTVLEKRLASLRNPLLPRSDPTGEEKEAWQKANQVERLRMTEKKLASAREELAAARAALGELR